MQQGLYALALIGAVPAAAQETTTGEITSEAQTDLAAARDSIPPESAEPPFVDPKTDVFDGDHLIVGLGVGASSEYDGASTLRLMPAMGAMGRISGINFRVRGPSITTDLYRDKPGKHLRFRVGPNLRYGGNRSGSVDDPVVAALGELERGFEAGVSFGASYRRIFHPYDSLAIGGSVRWDISGRHGGAIYGTGISYSTPLSPAQVFGLQLNASFSDNKHANYNYSVTPEGSAASGLPEYRAKGGLRELSVGAFTARDLSGDFRDGGFAVGVGVQYGRLKGSAARTPITSIRGTPNQWMLGGGVAYSF